MTVLHLSFTQLFLIDCLSLISVLLVLRCLQERSITQCQLLVSERRAQMKRKAVIIDGRLYCNGHSYEASCWPLYSPKSDRHEGEPTLATGERCNSDTHHQKLCAERYSPATSSPATATATPTRSVPPTRIRFTNQVSNRPLRLAPIKAGQDQPHLISSLAQHTFANMPGTSTTIAFDRSRQLPQSRRESQRQGLQDRWKRYRSRLGNRLPEKSRQEGLQNRWQKYKKRIGSDKLRTSFKSLFDS